MENLLSGPNYLKEISQEHSTHFYWLHLVHSQRFVHLYKSPAWKTHTNLRSFVTVLGQFETVLPTKNRTWQPSRESKAILKSTKQRLNGQIPVWKWKYQRESINKKQTSYFPVKLVGNEINSSWITIPFARYYNYKRRQFLFTLFLRKNYGCIFRWQPSSTIVYVLRC